MISIRMKVDGMTCGHCVARVQDAIRALPGVRSFEVSVGEVELWADPGRVTPAQVSDALEALGFSPHPPEAAAES
jgi:copper chaperone CopZ